MQDLGKINLSAIVDNKKNQNSESADYIDTTEKRKYDRESENDYSKFQDNKEELDKKEVIVHTSEVDDWYGGEPY